MTDKDIKDYCKNCDVEPPAMRFKCPECEHNPNNKNNKEQIIIDGVNVRKCESYNPLGNYSCGGCRRCEERSDCDFKQLAHKTQECEELKRKVELMMDCADCKVDEYKKALEEIEEYANTYFDKGVSKEIFDIINKIRR